MNRIYRLVFNPASESMQVAPETAKGRHKSGSVREGAAVVGVAMALMLAPSIASAQFVSVGGDVSASPDEDSVEEWTLADTLHVGDTGNGSLIIGNGGKVLAGDQQPIYVGYGSKSQGAITVEGAGSSLMGQTMVIGYLGEGLVTLREGGQASAKLGYLGFNASSQGTLDVAGQNTSWTSDVLWVGIHGTGFLTISDGAQVSSATGGISQASGSRGYATVQGKGSRWNIEDYLPISDAGLWSPSPPESVKGVLNILDGGKVISRAGVVGGAEKMEGTVTIAGEGSSWELSNPSNGSSGWDPGVLILGHSGGKGTLVIQDGGKMISKSAYVGYLSESSVGSIVVSGQGALWENDDLLFLGSSGVGSLTVAGGGKVTGLSGQFHIGRSTTGKGTLTIESGGIVSSASVDHNNPVSIGYLGGEGRATVSGKGSLWDSHDDIYVGDSGTGTLAIEKGGGVSNGTGRIGVASGSLGAATVSGAGSTWKNLDALDVGVAGRGTLAIDAGGLVSTPQVALGRESAGDGTLELKGGGDQRGVLETRFIQKGQGQAKIIFNGGTLRAADSEANVLRGFNDDEVTLGQGGGFIDTNAHDIGIGANFSGDGGLTKTGDGTLTLTGANNTYAGGTTVEQGTLALANGGKVFDGVGNIGDGAGSAGAVEISGNTSSWESSRGFYVGRNGTGTLTLRDGGTARAVNGPGGGAQVFLGLQAGSAGTLNIGARDGAVAVEAGVLDAQTLAFGEGAGKIVFNHTGETTFSTGLLSAGAGTHTLEQVAGTTVLTGDSARFSGTTHVRGGALQVKDGATLGGKIEVGATALLGGTGTVGATTVAQGGHLAPGNGDIGTLTVDGDLVLGQGSALDFEFEAPGADFNQVGRSDSVTVKGDLAVDGARLNLATTGDFGVGLYRLFDYTGDLTRTHGGIVLDGTVPDVSVQYLDDAKQVNLVNTAGMTLNIWNGKGKDDRSGIWANDASSWTDIEGRVTAPMQPRPGFAVFQGDGGTVSLRNTVEAGDVAATGLQFTGSGYVLQGDALTLAGGSGVPEIRVGDGSKDSAAYVATIRSAIAGSTGLSKTGAGTLVLDGHNTYTGATVLANGVLSVSDDGNLGHEDNLLALRGGTLRVTGQAFDSSRSIALDAGQNSVDVVERAVLRGGLQGPGSLVKRGAGTLVLAGTNAYGGTRVENGTLVGDVASLSGDIANAGTVEFAQDRDGAFGGAISALDGSRGDMRKTGGGTLTLAGPSQLDWTVSQGGLAASVTRFTGDAHLNGTATAMTLTDSDDVRYDGTLSGNGQLSFDGTGTTLLAGDSSGFSGHTTLANGTLLVGDTDGGALGGSMAVVGGAALGGSGTVGSGPASTIAVAKGAALTPGNDGIGMLTVDGNLSLAQGSALDFEFGAPGGDFKHAGQGDSVTVKGDLDLNGATLNLADKGGFGVGLYRLFDYAGNLTQGHGGIALAGAPREMSLQYREHQINLLNTAGMTLNIWSGAQGTGGDGTWANNGLSWTNPQGDVIAPMQPQPGFAIFQDQGGTIRVDGVDGAVQATGLQFAGDGYVLQGDTLTLTGGEGEVRVGDSSQGSSAYRASLLNAIAGEEGLNKTGAGTLVLAGHNTYAGGTTLSAGVLSVSDDANLGAESGALTFQGGTLAVTSDMEMARAVSLPRTGTIAVAADTKLDLAGKVSGEADLVKDGAGTLHLSNTANAYGDTWVRAGTLIGNADTISGNIGNAGTLVFEQADDARFAGEIAALDQGNGKMVKRGAGTLALTGRSSLDWSIASGSVASAAERFAGNADIATDGALVFDQQQDAAYHGKLSGTGRFDKTGAGVLAYDGDSSAFAGMTRIDAGALIVGTDASHGDAVLGGSVNVADGARLGGHGTVGSGGGAAVRSQVIVASGGTLAPGNSIGGLTIDGDLTVKKGARLEVEVDPRGLANDRVKVLGTATLEGGSVAHIGADGNYDLRSTHAILAADRLQGAFDDVTSDFAFLTPSLAYDYGHGTISLNLARNDVDFASRAQTRNQRETATGIDSIGIAAGNAVYDAIAQLPDNPGLVARSLDALSGDIHASAKSALIDDSRFIRNAANDRLREAFGHAGSSSMTYAPGTAPDGVGNVVWSQAFGSWGKVDGDGNAAALDHDTAGMLIGTDTRVGNWRLGALAGYSHSSFDTDDRHASGSSDDYHLGAYGGTQWGNLGVRAAMAYSWHDIKNHRSVSMPGLQDRLKSDYNAGTFQVFGELGYGMQMGDTRLEPYANLAYVHLHTDGFREAGGAAALSGSSDSTDTAFSTLGLRAEQHVRIGSVDASLRGALGWRYAFGETTPQSTHRFSAGDAFTVAGVPIARHAAVLEAGVDVGVWDNTHIGVLYTGQLAGSAHDHGVKADVTIRF